MTALDNLDARLHVDEMCVRHRIPLVDSGTSGSRLNVQVVLPHETESYGDSADPPEREIPVCTVKQFPYEREHCVSWGKQSFEESFNRRIER